jgi:hypothetical protein
MRSRKSTRRRASSSFVDKRKTRSSSTLRDSAAANGSAIETAGEIFCDGTAIELLRDPASPEGFILAHSQQGSLDVKPTLSHAGRVYVPVRVERSILKAVRFPTRVAPSESTKKLFTYVHTLLHRYLAQLDQCITAMVFTIFASWMSPVLPIAPILSIFAPAGSPKNIALQMLGMLCRHPLRLAGFKRGDIPRLPMTLQPTLLLDEPDLRPEMQTLLQSSAHRGTQIISSRGIVEFCGSKIICSRKLPHGTALETDALRIALIPVAGQQVLLDKKTEAEIAEECQSRFLGYLLRNSSRVQIPSFDVSQFSLPVQDLARAFGAAIVGDGELQQKILPLLSVQDEEILADRASAFDSIVLEAVLSFIHENGWTKVRIDKLAEKVSAIYKGRGFDQDDSAESVGWALRRLSIPSGRINRAGNGIELNVSTCRLVHKLALSHGVRAMQGGFFSDCRYCRELEAMVAQMKTGAEVAEDEEVF